MSSRRSASVLVVLSPSIWLATAGVAKLYLGSDKEAVAWLRRAPLVWPADSI